MIKPISISNQFVLKNQQTNNQEKEPVGAISYADFLSGYQLGQALKAQSRIGFKQAVFVPNTELKVIEDKNVSSFMETRYYYPSTTPKDNLIASFTVLLLIFLTPPYHEESSENISGNKGQNGYYKLCYSGSKNNDSSLTDEVNKQKELFNALHQTDFENTLASIKKYYIESLKEENDKNLEAKINLINSINVDDVKKHIEKYLIGQEPIVYVKKEDKDVKNLSIEY